MRKRQQHPHRCTAFGVVRDGEFESTTLPIDRSDPGGQSYVFHQVSNPTNGTVTLAGNGAFTYTPNYQFGGAQPFFVPPEHLDLAGGGGAV